MTGRRVPRLGLLLDTRQLPAWVRELAERVRAAGTAELVLALDAASWPDAPGPGAPSLLARALLRISDLLPPSGPDALKLAPGAPGSLAVEALNVEAACRRVVDQDVDLLLDLRGTGLPELLLAALPLGAWSAPPAWTATLEVLGDRPVVDASLRWLRAGRGPLQLALSHLAADRASPRRTRSRTCWRVGALLERSLERLGTDGAERLEAGLPPAVEEPSPPPSGAAVALRFAAHLARLARDGLVAGLTRTQWQILCCPAGDLPTTTAACRRLVPPADRSWADPFATPAQPGHWVFVEEKVHGAPGRIAVLRLEGDEAQPSSVPLLAPPTHLSYPFLLCWQGAWYLIPESSADGEIRSYRCAEFPTRWVPHRTLMRGVQAVDATLVEHGGRWWMFTCMAAHAGSSTRDELFLFHADEPLSERWVPHPLNPVVSDVRRARPAGALWTEDGRLYRPSQDCGERYGRRLRIQRVRCLTPTAYEEEEVAVIEPAGDLIAVHTLNRAGGLLFMDGKRRRWRRPLGRD